MAKIIKLDEVKARVEDILMRKLNNMTLLESIEMLCNEIEVLESINSGLTQELMQLTEEVERLEDMLYNEPRGDNDGEPTTTR